MNNARVILPTLEPGTLIPSFESVGATHSTADLAGEYPTRYLGVRFQASKAHFV